MVYGEDIEILAGYALLSTSFEHMARHTKEVTAERVLDVIICPGKSVCAIDLTDWQVMDFQ